MKFCSLASSSTGNVTYVETAQSKILIDIGMSCLYVEKNLKELGIDANSIDAIIITHTHSDHIGGLKVFLKKYHPLLYITEKMYVDLKDMIGDNEYTFIDDIFYINDLKVTPFSVSHDAPDTNGYVLESNGKSLVYVTDTGYINNKLFKILDNKNAYIFESNHDIKMLMEGKYQHHLKQRILSDRGHLSNKDCTYYLSKIIGDNTKIIVLAHLSKDNNTPDIALNTLNDMLKDNDFHVSSLVAPPTSKTEMMEI